MKRLVFNLIGICSALCAIASGYMWVRSFRALDEIYGQFALTTFDWQSDNGQLKLYFSRHYQLKPGIADPGPSLDDLPNAQSLLQRQADFLPDYFFERMRWPLGETNSFRQRTTFFRRLEWHVWCGWARQNSGHYDWQLDLIIPWWQPFVISAIVPTLKIARRFRPRVTTPANVCKICGYDLRATPERCPECGTIVVPSVRSKGC